MDPELLRRACFNRDVVIVSTPPPFLTRKQAYSFMCEAWARCATYTIGALLDQPHDKVHCRVMECYARTQA